MLTELERLIEACEPGVEKDQLQANLFRMRARLFEVPARVAALAPFKTADEARAVMEREFRAALAEFHRGN
jgi:hypothetical protein